MTRAASACAALLLLCLGALPAGAQQVIDSSKHDTSLPIEITADAMEVEQKEKRAIFLGAVDVVQGDINLKADELIVYYREDAPADANAVYRIEVEGNVHVATPTETAAGNSGVYQVDEGVITLVGNVHLTSRDDAILKGDKATMNLETGQSSVTADEGGRITSVFVPDKSGDDKDEE